MDYKDELIKAQTLLSELRYSIVCIDECGDVGGAVSDEAEKLNGYFNETELVEKNHG